MAETGIEFPLVEADAARDRPAGRVLPTSSLSEYGASIWVDPYRWIPEAARLLRPGGRLVFLRNSTLVILCSRRRGAGEGAPASTRSSACTASSGRTSGVEFHLPHGEWIDLLRANGFEIERLVEVQAPADAETHELLRLRHGRVGEASGRARRSGSRARRSG